MVQVIVRPEVRQVVIGRGQRGPGVDGTEIKDADFPSSGLMTRTSLGAYASRTITAGEAVAVTNGNGVSGNPSVALNVNGLTAEASPDGAADFAVIFDTSAATHKKVLLNNLPSSGGEVNTASNVGVGGVGPFKQKTGANLEFRNVAAGSTKVTVSLDAPNNEIDINVDGGLILDGEITSNGIAVRTAAETYTARTITAGTGVAVTDGNGVLGNPTIAQDINGLTELVSVDGAADFIPIYDTSAAAIRKVKPNNLPGGGGGGSAAPAYEWEYDDDTTDADPGAGKFRLNDTDKTAASLAWFDYINDAGTDMQQLLLTLKDQDYIYISQTSDTTRAALYVVDGSNAVDKTGYIEIPILYVSGPTANQLQNTANCGLLLHFPASEPPATDVGKRVEVTRTGSDQSISDSTMTVVQFATTEQNDDTYYTVANLGASNFYIGVSADGNYLIEFAGMFESANWTSVGYVSMNIFVNGTVHRSALAHVAVQNNVVGFNFSKTILLSAADQVNIRLYQNSGGSRSLRGDTSDELRAQLCVTRLR